MTTEVNDKQIDNLETNFVFTQVLLHQYSDSNQVIWSSKFFEILRSYTLLLGLYQ